MRKALLLAYHYPPLGGVAVMRVLRFSRYLRNYGWEPIVLCVDGGSKNEPRDQGLVAEIPEGLLVERVSCFEPDNYSDKWDIPKEKIVRNLFKTFDRILFPDDRALWIKPVTKRALELIEDHKIEVVWATAQPWSSLVAGRNIKKKSGVPLVLDFRDDWTTSNADFRKTNRLAREKALEQSVLKTADAIISVTPHIVEQLRARAPENLGAEQFHYIPNGFDPAHFNFPESSQREQFQIVHTGGLYHLRPVAPLLEVLDEWFAKHPERVEVVSIKLAGRITEQNRQEIERSPWVKNFQVLGFVEHQTVRKLISDSACNLLMIEQVKTAPWLFTGKVFEYIGARRPILMLGPDPSPLADLVKKTGLGHVGSYQTPKETAQILESLFLEHQNGHNSVDEAQVESFDASHQTAELAQIFEEVAKSGKI